MICFVLFDMICSVQFDMFCSVLFVTSVQFMISALDFDKSLDYYCERDDIDYVMNSVKDE